MPVGHRGAPAAGREHHAFARVQVEPGVAVVLRGRQRQVGIEPADRDLHATVALDVGAQVAEQLGALLRRVSSTSSPVRGVVDDDAHRARARTRRPAARRERELEEVHGRRGVLAGEPLLVLGRPPRTSLPSGSAIATWRWMPTSFGSHSRSCSSDVQLDEQRRRELAGVRG